MEFAKNKENQKLAERINVSCLEESLRFPKYFEIETVNVCNARCVMCTVNNWAKEKNAIMSQELFSKFVEEVVQYTDWIEVVCLNRDGEPTLDKNLSTRIKLLKEAGVKKVTFATNGQLLTPSLIYKLIDVGLDDIMISIDAATKETFECIRVGLNYDIVLNNTLELIRIRNERRAKMTIRIRMAVMEKNSYELKTWFNFWRSKVNKQDKVYAKPAHTWGNQIGREKEDTIAKYADRPCVSPFSTMIIKANGKVPLCGADYKVKYIMGDFSRQTIKEIWNEKHYTKLRLFHANKQRNKIDMCRGCHIWDEDLLINSIGT